MSIGKLARTSLLRDREREQDCAAGPFVKLRSLAAGAVLGVAIAAAWGTVPAGAVTATGVAVGSVGSSTPGRNDRQIAQFFDDAIKYFIPFNGTSGTYGTVGSCVLSASGLAPISGWRGRPPDDDPEVFTGQHDHTSTLSVVFEDLDLIGGNDPVGFLEKLNVFKSDGTSLTGLDHQPRRCW